MGMSLSIRQLGMAPRLHLHVLSTLCSIPSTLDSFDKAGIPPYSHRMALTHHDARLSFRFALLAPWFRGAGPWGISV